MPQAKCRCSSVKRICIGTDFSPGAEIAASYARALALSFSATVQIVHVFDSDIFLDDDEARLRNQADRLAIRSKRLTKVAETFGGIGIESTTTVAFDPPAWTGLLAAADVGKADLIVVATKSKAQLKRVFIGSTVEELIRRSNLPVMTIGPNVKSAQDGPLSFRRIVYATDFSAEAERAVKCALSFAAHGGASLHVCHVMEAKMDHSATAVAARGDVREAIERLVSENSAGTSNSRVILLDNAALASLTSEAKACRRARLTPMFG